MPLNDQNINFKGESMANINSVAAKKKLKQLPKEICAGDIKLAKKLP